MSPPTNLPSAASRRDFLRATAASAGVAWAISARETQAVGAKSSLGPFTNDLGPLIDVNLSLGPWPLRRVAHDEAAGLANLVREQGVEEAWVASLDGLLHKDLGAVNARLVEQCRRHGRGRLLPFGCLHPKYPDWEEELRRCVEVHRMPGLRLYPNYHGYSLDDPDFRAVLRAAADRHLIVQIALVMEDERMMHPRFRVEPVDATPLAEVVHDTPGARLVLVNALRTLRAQPLLKLLATDRVWVEIAMCEGIGGVGALLSQVPANRVLFGSHAPLFYFEAATLKLKESVLTTEQEQAIRYLNARRLVKW